jgi:hypothetical protein
MAREYRRARAVVERVGSERKTTGIAKAHAMTMTEKPPIETETPPREFNARAPCRVASTESDMRGRCMRCGAEIGEACPEMQK